MPQKPHFRSFLLPAVHWLLRRVVRFSTVPEVPGGLALDPQRPVCYALHIRQLSAMLVLKDAAARLGLPSPLDPLAFGSVREHSAFFFLTRSGQPSPLQPNPYAYSERLERLVAAARAVQPGNEVPDVQIVPVSIFWGRAPQKQDSIVRALFADNWVVPGAFRQGVRLLLHGRDTLVRFGEPISLRTVAEASIAERQDERTTLRRLARMLRSEFRRERELAVGPDLSHRHTLLNDVIATPAVREAISAESARSGRTEAAVELDARRMAFNTASDYSYSFIRAFELALTALWNRIYDGVDVHRFDDVSVANGAELVWVPCHRSHIDYLLLSYVIFRRGLQPPHIAAGENLNMPVVGPLLRRGGAFFLRRSFKGEPLYAAVFSEYLHAILSRGFPIEYFVEGGRSRTGLTLNPRAGILGMTVEGYLRGIRRPVVFVPVYIGYEQLLEGQTYVAELAGRPKQKESLFGIFRGLRALRRQFGRVHVNIGEPIQLGRFLDDQWPGWRDTGATPLSDDNEPVRRAAVAALAGTIVRHIQEAVVVNPVNLLAVAMLGTSRAAMDAGRLAEQVDLLKALLKAVPYSARQTLTELDGAAVTGYGERLGVMERIAHPLGDICRVKAGQEPLLEYFRNNVLHAYALPGLVACLLAQSDRIAAVQLVAMAQRLFPFLRAELFLAGTDEELTARVEQYLTTFVAAGLAREQAGMLAAPGPAERESHALLGLAGVLRQPLERYALVVATLARFGAGTLTSTLLEDCCVLLGQRMALLQDGGGPALYDRAAFRAIIRTLVQLGDVTEAEGTLHLTDTFSETASDAFNLLPHEVRLALHQVSQLAPADITQAAASLKREAPKRRQ